MTYTYQLWLADGTNLDTFKTSECNWRVGDELRAQGNVRYRITSIVPGERIGEFVDGREIDGFFQVEPL